MAEDTALGFTPVSRATVSQQIRDQLIDRIRCGDLPPGRQMPSERLLSEQFGVARTSIREAMQGLVSMGLVERRGNRAFVAEHLPEVVLDGDARKDFVRKLFETRRVLELPIFELAASRATDDERQRIAEIASAFESRLSVAEFRRLDRQFHTTIASACDNPLLVELYGKVVERLFHSEAFDSLLSDAKNARNVSAIVRQSSVDHLAIAEAIAAGDPVRTVAAAEEHLANVERRMLEDLR